MQMHTDSPHPIRSAVALGFTLLLFSTFSSGPLWAQAHLGAPPDPYAGIDLSGPVHLKPGTFQLDITAVTSIESETGFLVPNARYIPQFHAVLHGELTQSRIIDPTQATNGGVITFRGQPVTANLGTIENLSALSQVSTGGHLVDAASQCVALAMSMLPPSGKVVSKARLIFSVSSNDGAIGIVQVVKPARGTLELNIQSGQVSCEFSR
jgi:hypothetical protein